MLMISLLFLISCKALSFLNNYLSSTFYIRISSIILLYSAILIANTIDLNGLISTGIGIYGGLYHVTSLTQWLELFLLIIGGLILFAWPINNKLNNNLNSNSLKIKGEEILSNLIKNNNISVGDISELKTDIKYLNNSKDYSIIIIFSGLGASLLISSWDLISMYISIELQSFSLYILSTLYNQSEKSTSAGLKYFLLGGLASCLILLGSGFVYNTLGLTNFESIFNLLSVHILYELKSFHLGILIIFIGFLIKIAAAPLHNWSPDVYDDTPTIVTIWLTIIPKISILILLLEMFSQFNVDSINLSEFIINTNNITINNTYIFELLNNSILKNLLLIISLISLIIGGIVGLTQQRIKRLLAYSTISHLGFILLALTIFTNQSIESFIFYIFQYSVTNLNIFLIIIGLSYLDKGILKIKKIGNTNYYFQGIKDINLISELKSQYYNNPLIMLCLSICLFSLAGIPPLIGFFSKQFVLLSSLQEGYYFISLVAIIVSVVSASYYLKIIKEIYTEDNSSFLNINLNNNKTINNNISTSILINNKIINGEEFILSNFHSYLISILTLFILFFILKSSLILNPIFLVVSSIFNIT